MKKWSVLISVDASVSVEVEADTEEKAKELAMEQVDRPSICHQCSRHLDVGEVIDVLEAIQID